MEYNFTKATGTFYPLRDGVLVRDMKFETIKTASGIYIPNDDATTRGIHPRWCQVIAIGKEQEEVKVDDWILVSHGRWSRGFELNGETVRTVDPTDILIIQDEPPKEEVWKSSMGHQRELSGNALEYQEGEAGMWAKRVEESKRGNFNPTTGFRDDGIPKYMAPGSTMKVPGKGQGIG